MGELKGAKAILKLRALTAGDLDDYWRYPSAASTSASTNVKYRESKFSRHNQLTSLSDCLRYRPPG